MKLLITCLTVLTDFFIFLLIFILGNIFVPMTTFWFGDFYGLIIGLIAALGVVFLLVKLMAFIIKQSI